MKQAIILLAITLLFIPRSNAQTFAVTAPTVNKIFTEYPTTNFINYQSDKRICGVTTAGIVFSGVGMVTGALGGILVFFNQGDEGNVNQRNTGEDMFIAGGVIGTLGLLMSIGGTIHDVTEYRKARFGLIAPKKNEIGLAYKF